MGFRSVAAGGASPSRLAFSMCSTNRPFCPLIACRISMRRSRRRPSRSSRSRPQCRTRISVTRRRSRHRGVTSLRCASTSSFLKTSSDNARRYPWRRAFLFFLAALFVKGAVLFALHDHPLLQPRGDLDEAIYVALAKHLPAQPFFVSPLYLYFLRSLGVSLAAARVVQIFLALISV